MMPSTRDQLDELSGRIKEISKLIGSCQQARRHLLGRPRVRTGADAWPYVLHVALVVWVLRRDPVLASQLVAQFEGKQANATWSAQSIESQGEALDTAPPLLAVAWLFLQKFLQSPSPGRALKGAFLENCPGLRLVSAHRNSSRAPRLEAP